MTLTFNGRLPGVICQSALPVQQEATLRLDVAAFVGFAERGPVDQPIMVEDISQYHALFGQDLPLARQGRDSKPIYAHLPTAIHAFFDNGGRRCYVVRVVGPGARANRFRFPGLISWDGSSFAMVVVPAAWVGRWSDDMSFGTQLRTLPLRTSGASLEKAELQLVVSPQQSLRAGDLLRLQFAGTGKPVVFCTVAEVQKISSAMISTLSMPITARLQTDTLQTFTRNIIASQPVRIERNNGATWEELSTSLSALEELPQLDDGYALNIELSDAVSIKANDTLRIYCANEDILIFSVDSVEELPADTDKLRFRLVSHRTSWQFNATRIERLTETGWQTLASPSGPLNAQTGSNRQYTLDLPDTEQVQAGDLLRVTCAQNRTLLLPIPTVSLQMQQSDDVTQPAIKVLEVFAQAGWWEETASALDYGELIQADLLSFDLVIREGQDTREIWQDLRFSPGPGYWLDIFATETSSDLKNLSGPGVTRSMLLGAPAVGADRTLYIPLGMDELLRPENFVTPLPDTDTTLHLVSQDGLERYDPVTLFLDPRLACSSARDLLNQANQILYLNPGSVEPLRKLHSLLTIDEIGLISLPDSVHPGWKYADTQAMQTMQAQSVPGPDWSRFQPCAPLPVPVSLSPMVCGDPLPINLQPLPAELPELIPPEQYQMDALLTVQRALINFCAARSDVLAVLSLPQHFQSNAALAWQKRLTSTIPGQSIGTTLSFVAVYHPWLQRPEVTTPALSPLRAIPPDGAVCGMIAAREMARGPWIAPANVPLLGVVGLTPIVSTVEWSDLFNAQINIIRQQPGQFTLLSAHSLSPDNQLLQISVRRLLIFLRKLALQRGMSYVFESNNERFRQRVQAGFERTLTILLEEGAISAFAVVTGSEINSANDVDNGRFLIALQVAPTQPVEFITIMLVRAGEGLLEVLER